MTHTPSFTDEKSHSTTPSQLSTFFLPIKRTVFILMTVCSIPPFILALLLLTRSPTRSLSIPFLQFNLTNWEYDGKFPLNALYDHSLSLDLNGTLHRNETTLSKYYKFGMTGYCKANESDWSDVQCNTQGRRYLFDMGPFVFVEGIYWFQGVAYSLQPLSSHILVDQVDGWKTGQTYNLLIVSVVFNALVMVFAPLCWWIIGGTREILARCVLFLLSLVAMTMNIVSYRFMRAVYGVRYSVSWRDHSSGVIADVGARFMAMLCAAMALDVVVFALAAGLLLIPAFFLTFFEFEYDDD